MGTQEASKESLKGEEKISCRWQKSKQKMQSLDTLPFVTHFCKCKMANTAPLSGNNKEYPTSVYISSYINGFYLLNSFLEPTMEINVVIILII